MIYQKNCLLDFTSKDAFLECLSLVNNCFSDEYYFYKCHLFSGCESYIGHKAYGFVFRIRDTYGSSDFELVKYQPVN